MMTVTAAHFWTIKPGRREDALAHFRQGKEAVESVGGQNVRLRRVATGELTNLYYALHDVESLLAYGAHLDRGARSEQVRELLANAWQADSPVTYLGNWVMSEITRFGEVNPSAVAFGVRNWDVKPGRADEFVEVAGLVAPIVESNGGFGQMWRVVVGGEMTGVYTTAVGFPNLELLYAFLEEMQTSPEAREMAAKLDDDPPAVTRAYNVTVNVPL